MTDTWIWITSIVLTAVLGFSFWRSMWWNRSDYFPLDKDFTRIRRKMTAEDTARLRMAMDALEPFAAAAEIYDHPEDADDNMARSHDFEIGSLRRARAARDALAKMLEDGDG